MGPRQDGTIYTILFILYSAFSAVSADIASFTQTTDNQCSSGPEPTRVHDKIQCAALCSSSTPGSSLCFDPDTFLCSCCSDNRTLEDPSKPRAIECFKIERHESTSSSSNGTLVLTNQPYTMDFDTCKIYCETGSSTVLMPDSLVQVESALGQLQANPGPSDMYWLGMTTNSTSDTRNWFYSSTASVVTFSFWEETEPNGHTLIPPEYCAACNVLSSLKWADLPCGWALACTCQTIQ